MTATHNISLPNEPALVQELTRLYEKFLEQMKTFWKVPDLAARRSMYSQEILPALTAIKDISQQIIHLNQESMVQADHKTRELSAHSMRTMGLASIVGIALAVLSAIRLQRAILQPMESLRLVSQKLGEGELDQVVPVSSKDELGQLAEAFNKMASQLRAYRRATTDQLLQAQHMTEITFSAFPDPIIVFSPECRINFTNPAAATLLQKLGKHLPQAMQEPVEQLLRGGADYLPIAFDKAIIIRVEEKEVFFLPRIIGIRDESGHLFGAAVILQDVTRLRLLDDVKNNLVSTVSHELKTPLCSVRMGLYLLLEEKIGSLNSQQIELLLTAREDTDRLLAMINDWLDLSRFESGGAFFSLEKLNSETLVRTVWKDFYAFVECRGSKLLTTIEPDLPSVRVDIRQISQVFSNLLSNAVKHIRYGEQIMLAASKRDDKVRFSVIHQGEGIAPQYQSRIFERFFRVPGTESEGAGLGLAIAKEIVVAHGGSIGVISQEGSALEFYVDLPSISPET